MKSIVTIIPVYNKNLSDSELISFNSILINLSSFPICIVTHSDLDLSSFHEFARIKKVSLKIKYFSKNYFESISSYNKLLMSRNFYFTFKAYEYILIAQLDAFIFKRDIAFWINKNYSYIGAPWLDLIGDTCVFKGVGNGGLSLRKISDHLRIFKFYYIFSRLKINFSSHFNQKLTIRFFLLVLLDRIYKTDFKGIHFLFTKYKGYEDTYWGINVPKCFSFFHVPNEMEALGFSFELEPRFCFELNNGELPFGCHAWERYDFDFWKEFIH